MSTNQEFSIMDAVNSWEVTDAEKKELTEWVEEVNRRAPPLPDHVLRDIALGKLGKLDGH